MHTTRILVNEVIKFKYSQCPKFCVIRCQNFKKKIYINQTESLFTYSMIYQAHHFKGDTIKRNKSVNVSLIEYSFFEWHFPLK